MSESVPSSESKDGSASQAESKSEFDGIWASFSSSATSSCRPDDQPPGAIDQPVVAEKEVPHTGGQHVKGEEFACGEWRGQKNAPCETATVIVAAGRSIVAVRRFAKENFNNTWHADPAMTMGWCDWAGMSTVALPDGRTVVATTLKNWSHDRPRLFRLEVWVR